ncbi:MAG: type III-B CRISPR module-associated protein Cmr3 [Thermoanaerobacteraceae bacterium]|nr:type III-B CRISPR module-associated protein Cmr3 [Thermoanaerobacteraceae bacterium]
MLLKTEPIDTLFFRDGKPFNMGEDTWSNSVFPPYPSVFYGALRTAYFAKEPDSFDLRGKENDPTLALKIHSVLLNIWDNYYFPLPRDLVREKDSGEKCAFPLQLQDAPYLSNCPLPKTLGVQDKVVETIANGIIDRETLQGYLENSSDLFYYSNLKEYVTQEPKIGIGIDKKSGTAADTQLYRSEMLRLAPECSIVIDYEGIELSESGFLKLGGEGKAAFYNHISNKEEAFLPSCSTLDNQYFKLYLLSPAVLSNGWLPAWIDPQSLAGIYEGLKVKLLAVALGKYVSVGGFDIKKGRPKPMVRAVPSGSVYYFELLEGEKEKVKQVFHYQPFENNDYAKEGFGTVLVGRVNP